MYENRKKRSLAAINPCCNLRFAGGDCRMFKPQPAGAALLCARGDTYCCHCRQRSHGTHALQRFHNLANLDGRGRRACPRDDRAVHGPRLSGRRDDGCNPCRHPGCHFYPDCPLIACAFRGSVPLAVVDTSS